MTADVLTGSTYAALGLASLSAGFVDAAAGGGGLIQLPALILLFPHTPFPILSGTNKSASAMGTVTALTRYQRSMKIPAEVGWRLVPPMFLGAVIGAHFVSSIDQHYLKPGVAAVLLLVWILAATRKPMAVDPDEDATLSIKGTVLAQMAVTFAIGMYDGLIGPGTGMFLIFSMVYLGGTTFLAASGLSKLLNLTSNIAAVLFFLWKGEIWGPPLLAMIPAQILGGRLGASCAVRYGSVFVRKLSLWVTAALIAKLLYDVISVGS